MRVKILIYLMLVASLNTRAEEIKISKNFLLDYKTRVEGDVRNYYDQLGMLIGSGLSDEDKNWMISNMKEEFFRSQNTRIHNDIPGYASKSFDVNEYINNFNLEYGNKEGELALNKLTVSDIYYDDLNDFYFMVASIERKINLFDDKKPDKIKASHPSSLNIMFNFFANNRNVKIYSIQTHKEDILANRIPVPISTSSNYESVSSSATPFFIFKLTPPNAEVLVNDVTQNFVNGDKEPTSPGKKKIQISAPRYNTLTFEIDIDDEGVYEINRSLTPKMGTLSLIAEKEEYNGAEIYLKEGDQKNLIGTIPFQYSLPMGVYSLQIRKKDFYKKRMTVVVKEEQTPVVIALKSSVAMKEIGKGLIRGVLDGLNGGTSK